MRLTGTLIVGRLVALQSHCQLMFFSDAMHTLDMARTSDRQVSAVLSYTHTHTQNTHERTHKTHTHVHTHTQTISTFTPVGSLSLNGLRMRVCVYSTGIVRNELICGYANVMHTSSSFRPHTHTHILIPFEEREPTWLIVDIAHTHTHT